MVEKMKPGDRVNRGTRGINPAGVLSFAALRLADPLLQLALLTRRLDATSYLAKAFGGHVSPANPTAATMGLSLATVNALPAYQTLILSMALTSTVKHIFWLGYITNEELLPSTGVFIGLFNNAFNSFNSIVSLWSVLSPVTSVYDSPGELAKNPAVVIGTLMFAVGAVLETASEVQRKVWKDKPENKGKVYTRGLFAFARHVNYAGYMLWRGGSALASGGWAWGAIVTGMFFNDFRTVAIPQLDEYCTKRYGEQWAKYKQGVKWRLIPGIL